MRMVGSDGASAAQAAFMLSNPVARRSPKRRADHLPSFALKGPSVDDPRLVNDDLQGSHENNRIFVMVHP